MVDLIPGTSIPIQGSFGSPQPEGRGEITELAPGRQPVSMFDRIANRDDISPAELAYLAAAIRHFDHRPRKLKTIYDSASRVTDGTTGNVVIPLFIAPAGVECHITQILVDMPSSGTTVTPSAPFLNASSFAYLAIGPDSSGDSAANADNYRQALAAFWPNPALATNPMIPAQSTFNDKNAPVMFGGEMASYVIHGGSQAGIVGKTVQVTYRIEIYGFEDGNIGT